jgi:hypothetical protein
LNPLLRHEKWDKFVFLIQRPEPIVVDIASNRSVLINSNEPTLEHHGRVLSL